VSLVGRIVVVLFALMFAVFAAGLTLAFSVAAPEIGAFDSDPAERATFFVVAFFATGMAGAFALLPALVLIAVAEGYGIRSFLYYATAGAVLGWLAYMGSGFGVRFEETTDIAPVTHAAELVVAAGIAGGLVYWLFAGRNAGRWRERMRG
jgi:hypothetical protein